MEEYYQRQLDCLCGQVRPLSEEAKEASVCHWDGIAKPLNGLGRFETILTQIAGIQRTENLSLDRKAVVVFCADNGVVEEGVSQTDSSVTAIVTENFARGIASVNRMASTVGAEVLPVDIGVAGELHEPGIRNMKVDFGTKNFCREMAMTREQALEAIHNGIALAGELKDAGYDILAVGEMGIGNTTTSSAIASVLLDVDPEAVTGKGAGLSDEGLTRKIDAIRRGIALHHPAADDPIGVLASLGGFDIAGMTGLMLGGAISRIPVVLDGIISEVAGLLAMAICPQTVSYLIPSHLGKEPACAQIYERLHLEPVIHGNLALGEGTGAVILFPLLDMAWEVYKENSTFEDIHVKAYEKL